jgi:flavin reductase (DIM6/NTAB) family NADH-FMN oxidoreductase RutF
MNRTEFVKASRKIKDPAKLAVAVTKDKNDKVNMITLEWFMRTSIKPPMFAVSIGHTRYSYECFQTFRKFNLMIPSKEMRDTVKICGSKSGRDIDKLDVCNEDSFKGRHSNLPIFRNAVANFECVTTSQVKSGDHTIFVGEVKYSWLNEDKELLLIEDLKTKE